MLRGMTTQNKQHDFKGLTDFFSVFKAGTQTDSKGNTKDWTHEELDQIVSNTKARAEKNIFNGSPLVVGHPATNGPAYGWLLDVKRDGDDLQVKADDKTLHDEFANGVEEGRWPNRSVRIAKDDNGFYLAHVGFLGAAPPAVKGMDAIYAADEGEFFDYADADTYTPNVLTRFMRGMRDFIIDKFDIETADKVVPDYQIESMTSHANSLHDNEDPDQPLTSFNKPEGDKSMSEFTQAQLDEAVEKARQEERIKAEGDFSQKKADLESELNKAREDRLRVDFAAQVDALVDAGQLTPAQAEGMVDFMLALDAAGEATEFEFSTGEGDKAETKKQSPVDWFTNFTKSIGKQVELGESGAGDDTVTDFGGDPQAIANAAVEYQSAQATKGVTVSISDAVAHVTKGAKS